MRKSDWVAVMKVFGRIISILLCLFVLSNCSNDVDYQIHIFGLTEGHVLESDTVSFSFLVSPEDWQEKGLLVHFLLDRMHLKSSNKDTIISFNGLTIGAHAIIGTICGPDGIVIKKPNNLIVRNFYSQVETQPLLQVDKPLLVVFQPQKELFRGKEANKILFDFRVMNANLGAGYRLHYNLDGQDYFLDKEKHVWLENANRIGGHELTITLETEAGNPVLDNPFNTITKKFGVREK